MKIRDLMSAPVITIKADAPIKEAASKMMTARVSGLVVVDDDGAVVGVVSEADLVETEAHIARTSSGLAKWLGMDAKPRTPTKIVSDIMTKRVLTIDPDVSHRSAARVMMARGVKRLPVVDDGELIGIISRTDIVKAFDRSDREIRSEITEELLPRVLWIDPKRLSVVCEDGVVYLRGQLATKEDAELVEYMTQRIDGVIDVVATLTWEHDQAETRPRPEVPNPFHVVRN